MLFKGRLFGRICVPLAMAWFLFGCVSAGTAPEAPVLSLAADGTAPSEGALKLSQSNIPDSESLDRVAKEIGLRRSGNLSGAVDNVQTPADELVSMSGWALDAAGDSTPLTIIAFAGGKVFAMGETLGPRSDIERTFKLSKGAAANLAFGIKAIAPVRCAAGESFVVVAVNRKGEFAPLGFWKRDASCAAAGA